MLYAGLTNSLCEQRIYLHVTCYTSQLTRQTAAAAASAAVSYDDDDDDDEQDVID